MPQGVESALVFPPHSGHPSPPRSEGREFLKTSVLEHEVGGRYRPCKYSSNSKGAVPSGQITTEGEWSVLCTLLLFRYAVVHVEPGAGFDRTKGQRINY